MFRTVQVYSSIIVAGPILRVLNKLRKTAVLMHYKMPGGHSTTLYTERLRLEVQPFGIPLSARQERYPFCIASIEKYCP